MARCVSCGAEAEQGEIFCPACRAAIGPGPESDAGEEKAASLAHRGNGAAQEAPIRLTPTDRKKVIRRGEQARKAYESAAGTRSGKARGATKEAAAPSITIKKGKSPAEKLEGLKKGARNFVEGSAASLLTLVRSFWGWLKRLALMEKPAYDAIDWAAAAVGALSCLALASFFLFFELLRFEYVLSEQSSPLAQKVPLRGADLGAPGIMLVTLAGLALVFLGADALTWGRGRRFPLNTAFLSILAIILCILLLMVCLLSDGILVRYAGKKAQGKASYFLEADREGKIGWARRVFVGGAYLCLLAAVIAFASVGILLAESRELPAWVGTMVYRMKSKKKKGKEKGKGGDGGKEKGESPPGPN